MKEPRGAVTGGAPERSSPERADTDAPEAAAGTGGDAPAEPTSDRHLDASAHAHLLSEPLPPDAATETAILYNVTLGAPPPPDGGPTPAAAPAPAAGWLAATEGVGGATAPATDLAEDPTTYPATDAFEPGPFAAGRAGAGPAAAATVAGPSAAGRRTRPLRVRRSVAAALGLLLLGLVGLTTYLWVSAVEWRDQARGYLGVSQGLGDDLATTRNQLAGSQAELEAVRAQLSTAHERIVELADEKNQALDDWEFTQQLVDYQQRVSDAAGGVALALDRCVQGQQELIGYLQQQAEDPDAPPYDPEQLDQFETDVELLCQEASEANISLQIELSR